MFVFTNVEITLSLVTFFIVLLITKKVWRKRRLPPGPWGIPILGNILQVEELPHISFGKMKEKYGDVFLLKLGMVPVVVVSGLETIKRVLLKQGEQFADRPKLYTFSLVNDGTSMAFSEDFGDAWKLHKKIAKMSLREFSKSSRTSSSQSTFEEFVSLESEALVETLLLNSVKGYFDPSDNITYAVASVVCALCYGKHYRHDDEEFLGVIKINEEALKASGSAAPADFIPILRFFPLPGLKAFLQVTKKFNNFTKKQVKEHYESYDKNHIRDITDALICCCSRRKLEDKLSALSDAQILSTVSDIFGADALIGGVRVPTFDDRHNLHFTEAFIHEVFRHSSFTPFALPHCTTRDTVLNGYFIPKNTCIFVNLHQVHHDPDLWENPECFKPERFLDKDGKLDKQIAQNVIIFGMGVRKCLGEELARNELFLMLTIILQKIQLEKRSSDELILTPNNGMTLKPKQYVLKAIRRC
ncbi:cytochrome P450 1A3-like isoform 2-T2 [Anomaloglossus baeobatrachus]|uniref:cytochrome P450 1A3-like isoform X2 n=1 Tax=Anomaloglossus baeobatrachus TaxID=238106 RepID=UPI003F50C35D